MVAGGAGVNFPELTVGFFAGAVLVGALWRWRVLGPARGEAKTPEPDSRPEPNTQSFLRLPPSDSAPDRSTTPPAEKGTLRALDEALVKERLKPFLHDYEIDSLLKRRKKLVEHFQGLIAQRGEAQVLFTLSEEKQKP